MPDRHYALLVLPAFNAVYADAAPRLSCAELGVFNQAALGGRLTDIALTTIGGAPYVRFSCDGLGPDEIAILSNLSSIYVLFELIGDALHPVELHPSDRFPGDLITIQRYRGKTNPYLTKLLMNLTVLSTDHHASAFAARLNVLDPLCGRGTTLNQALMYGFNAFGVDVDDKDYDAYRAFISHWMKDKRLKHTLKAGTLGKTGRHAAQLLDIELGETKEGFKAGEVLQIEYLNADTATLGARWRRPLFDAIVTDLPYGVQHASHDKSGDLARRPLELLESSLPTWISVLKSGGALGLAWNTRVASREKLAEVLGQHGELEVLDGEAWRDFRHVVDQSITRDLIVARRG